MPSILTLFALSFLGLLIVLFTGKVFFFVFRPVSYINLKFYSKLFFEILTGIIIITVIKSILATSFQTINLLFLLLPIEYLIYKIISKQKTEILKYKIAFVFNKESIISYTYLLVLFLIVGLLNASYLYSIEGAYKLPDQDLFYYSRVSNALELFGKENTLFSYNQVIESGKNGILLYHYFDLWLNAFLFKLFAISSYLSLSFVTYPILIFTASLGIIGLWEKIGTINFWKIIISVLFFFVFGSYFEFYKLFKYMKNTIPLLTDTMVFTYYGRKLIIVSIFALFILNLFWDKKNHIAIQFILFTTIVYTSGTLIGLLGSTTLLIFVLLIYRKRLNYLNVQKRTIIFILIFILAFILFVYFNQVEGFSDGIVKNSIFNFKNYSSFLLKAKSALSVIFYFSIIFIFCYFLYFIILILNYNKIQIYIMNISVYIIISIFALAIGMFFLFVFYEDLNARQFFTNLLPFLNCLLILFIIILYEQVFKKDLIKVKSIFSIFLIILILYINVMSSIKSQKYYGKLNEKYSRTFIKDVEKELNKFNKNSPIAYRLELKTSGSLIPLLFSNFQFLDLLGYTNFINNSKIKITLSDGKSEAYELFDYVEYKKDTSNYQFNFLKEKKIKILVSDEIQSDIPKQNIDKLFTNSDEFIYFLKY